MEKSKIVVAVVVSLVFGFLIGKVDFSVPEELQIVEKDIQPEITLVQLKKIVGDELVIDISGPSRVLWAEENYVENDGEFKIPLGQIPTENDLELRNFAYVGNAKTMKFYPATSYPARGTEFRYRRFFQSKEAALGAGFVASKLVK
ncbi:MAG: hypothetical protein OEL89_01070 [Candidatus Peregrinibacteria bacterium]|nr:hypothetical protein [Candidatus Peregrinibacteria bacterium]